MWTPARNAMSYRALQSPQSGYNKRARGTPSSYRVRPAARVYNGMLRARSAFRRSNRVRRPELKSTVIQGATAGTGFGQTEAWITPLSLLTPIANGSEETERVGSKINCKWIDVKLDVNTPNSTIGNMPIEGATVMFAIWLDKLGGTPSTAQMYDDPAEGALAFPNPLWFTKYKLLKTFECVISPTTGAAGQVLNVALQGHYEIRVPVNCVLEYSGASAQDALNKGIWITACVSDIKTGAAGNYVTFEYRSRMYYTDQ